MNSLNREKLLNEINAKWTNKKCPMCNRNNWNISKNMVAPMALSDKGDIELGGQIMPLVALTCMNCGNVLFVNPLVIGAVDTSNEE